MYKEDPDLLVTAITEHLQELSIIGSLYGESALQNHDDMLLQFQRHEEDGTYRWILIAPDRRVTSHAVDVSAEDMKARIDRFAEGM